jgi:hypothetical protein
MWHRASAIAHSPAPLDVPRMVQGFSLDNDPPTMVDGRWSDAVPNDPRHSAGYVRSSVVLRLVVVLARFGCGARGDGRPSTYRRTW